MTSKVKELPNLFELIESYEKDLNSTIKNKYLSKAYELILSYLENGKNEFIHDALQLAEEADNEIIYEQLSSITLNSIHQLKFIKNKKEYLSTLFIVPYFTITEQPSEKIHYPPTFQIENIFQKHFLSKGLIDNVEQLHLPGIKINSDHAYDLDFSDWFHLHHEALHKTLVPENDEYRNIDLNLSVPDGGDLSFFPILIIHENNELIKIPSICDLDYNDLPFEETLNDIEKDVSSLSGTGIWSLGAPSHCENALDFGLEIQQDFALDSFFRTFVQRLDIHLVIFPLEEGDVGLIGWNIEKNSIEAVMELYYYSAEPDEFIDNLLQQISFHDIQKTYIFQESIGLYSIDDSQSLQLFDLDKMAGTKEVIIIEKPLHLKPTLH